MSGRLVGEVVEWLRTPAARGLKLSAAERNVLFIVAERAHQDTRLMLRHRTDDESLFERIRGALDVSEGSLGNILGRLAKRGLEVRVPTGVDKRGRPTFANNGHSMRFQLPEFPASVSLPASAGSPIDGWTNPVDEPPGQPVDNRSGNEEKPHPSMDLDGESPIDGWTIEGGRSIDGWTVSPSKKDPSKTSPSTPVVPVTQGAVERPSAVHREPSARSHQSSHRQPPLMLALPEPSRGEAAASSITYEGARDFLATLPDLGSGMMTAARAAHPTATLPELVIHAAQLARRTA